MAKEDNSGMMTALIVGAGGLAVYWYLTSYGPNGAVSAGAISYWQSWFGTVAASTGTPALTTTAPPVTNTLGPVTPAPAGVTMPAQASSVSFPSPFTVTADVNNSLKGTILVNGSPMSVNVISGNYNSATQGGTGVVWNSAGQDITSVFTPAQLSTIVPAFVTVGLEAGLSGIIQVPWHPNGANLSGVGMSFNSGQKGFSKAFSSRRKSTGPYVN